MSGQTTLVLALGNPLRGDDGIGAAVLTRLERECVPAWVSLVDGGTPGLETVLLLHGYQHVIIIDAADMDLAAGQWRRFRLDEVILGRSDMEGTLHNAGLAEALSLGAALGMLPDDLIMYGIQPTSTAWTIGLAPEIEAVLPALTSAILHDLGQMK